MEKTTPKFDGDRFFVVYSKSANRFYRDHKFQVSDAARYAFGSFVARHTGMIERAILTNKRIFISLRVIAGNKQVQREQQTICMAEWYQTFQQTTGMFEVFQNVATQLPTEPSAPIN